MLRWCNFQSLHHKLNVSLLSICGHYTIISHFCLGREEKVSIFSLCLGLFSQVLSCLLFVLLCLLYLSSLCRTNSVYPSQKQAQLSHFPLAHLILRPCWNIHLLGVVDFRPHSLKCCLLANLLTCLLYLPEHYFIYADSFLV